MLGAVDFYWVSIPWGPMTHICVGKLTTIGSDNGLSPGRRQAIILTSAIILLMGLLNWKYLQSKHSDLPRHWKFNIHIYIYIYMIVELLYPANTNAHIAWNLLTKRTFYKVFLFTVHDTTTFPQSDTRISMYNYLNDDLCKMCSLVQFFRKRVTIAQQYRYCVTVSIVLDNGLALDKRWLVK